MAEPVSQPGSSSVQEDGQSRAAARRATKAARSAERRRLKAVRDAQRSGQDSATYRGADGTDIVVVGLRQSVRQAVEKKRRAKQIVDSVVAEDAGKLPDNNVVEALARVTGVQINRARGEGAGFTIRGLTDVQTTVNGNNTNQGVGRSISLSDIPAELIKSIDVYKTRTSDQVEGGIGGSVNIELRRPLDLKKGLTVAGSIRGVYSDNPEKVSPFASLLIAERKDTGIGEIGILVNGSYNKNYYRETFAVSEVVEEFCCGTGDGEPNTPRSRLPAGQKNLAAPYRVNFGLDEGYNERYALNVAAQWKPTDDLDFVLEGGYLRANNSNQYDGLFLTIREGTLSNIVTQPDGVTLKSATVSGNDGGNVPAGFNSLANDSYSNLYTTNFETNWRQGIANVHVGVQYNWSNSHYYSAQVIPVLYSVTSAEVDLVSPRFANGGPFVSFPGIDLTNPANYGVERFQDFVSSEKNTEFASQLDIELAVSETGLIRRLKTGVRFNNRTPSNGQGYRDGYPRTDQTIPGNVRSSYVPLTSFPGGDQIRPVSALVPGAEALTWLHIPGRSLLGNIDAIRSYIQANDPGNAELFSTVLPPSDRGQIFKSRERSFAFYGQFDYAFKLIFPVDGTIGARVINTAGYGTSTNFQFGPNIVNGPIITTGTGRGNYVDILPAISATVHFSPKFQLRLSRTVNIERPSFFSLRPSAVIDEFRVPTYVYTGNPDLKPNVSKNYDASLEYYLKDGIISLAAFVKNQNGLLFEFARPANLSAYGIDRDGFIQALYNVGKGKIVGFEGNAQTFFRFLPGILRNFGAGLNGTYIPEATQDFPYGDDTPDVPGRDDIAGLSRYTGNATLFYETPMFSTRVSFNYRSRYRNGVNFFYPQYSDYTQATSRLDAAINYTPLKFVTLSLEGTNLLRNNDMVYYGIDKLLPQGARLQPRTVQLSARFRF